MINVLKKFKNAFAHLCRACAPFFELDLDVIIHDKTQICQQNKINSCISLSFSPLSFSLFLYLMKVQSHKFCNVYILYKRQIVSCHTQFCQFGSFFNDGESVISIQKDIENYNSVLNKYHHSNIEAKVKAKRELLIHMKSPFISDNINA